MKKDKNFANTIIDGLANTKNYFSQVIVYFAIKHYESDYHPFFENLIKDAQFEEDCQEYGYSDMLGEIKQYKDFDFINTKKTKLRRVDLEDKAFLHK